ncbi:hypothetical protein COO91_07945 [Nostoc flagelliforme CCNUN1]|uniref:Uncharacterized protein n=1 Tax=Nostoc flagelliforme CCNUN1 TaxID=2038116 RepID=A0A2K8T2G1_9NOSO|nr:hypothetical protein COO91_07945 [Nostoc flagelliforme CCNUN1]
MVSTLHAILGCNCRILYWGEALRDNIYPNALPWINPTLLKLIL